MAEDEEVEEKETIYDEEGREELMDDDELSPEEEGFMRGYDDAEEEAEEKEEKEEKDE